MTKIVGFPLTPEMEEKLYKLLQDIEAGAADRPAIADIIYELCEMGVEHHFKQPIDLIIGNEKNRGAIYSAANFAIRSSLKVTRVAVPQVTKKMTAAQMKRAGEVIAATLYDIPN